MRVLCVVGARPNYMKVKPVMDALLRRRVPVTLVHTGQHYDMAMSGSFFDELDLPKPDRYLGVGSGSQAEQTGRAMVAFEPLIDEMHADIVVVVGDVNSSLAAALVTAKSSAQLAHVEAGLRSGDWSMPEEVNRVVTDRLSDYLFAPSPDAVEHLRAEGHREGRIHLVGNVMIDSLLANLSRARSRPILTEMGLASGEYGLVTLHRPANVNQPDVFAGLLRALGVIAKQCPLVFPSHPRTTEQLRRRTVPDGLTIIEPLGYLDFLALESHARIVLTDSGGVQEETTVLGVPCLTLRDNTERPLTVVEGTNRVVGRDPGRIVKEANEVLRNGVTARRPALWDGHASDRIAEILISS